MSFNNTLVSALVASKGKPNHPQNDPVNDAWPWKLDGFPVRRELYEMGIELRRSYHGFRFIGNAVSGTQNNKVSFVYDDKADKTNTFYADIYVYIDGFDYVIGRIGYGSYGVKVTDKMTYVVQSRKINNEKFMPHRQQYYMMFVSDQKKAVRVALAKLPPHSAKEMADATLHEFKYCIENIRAAANRKVVDLINPLRTNNILMREMRNLIAQNTMFVTEEFQRVAAEFIKAEAEAEELRDKPIHGYYVYVRMVGDEQWVDIVEATDAQKYNNVKDCPATSIPAVDVPEDIQGKVAVLSMATIGQYMRGVGIRASEKSFWLER